MMLHAPSKKPLNFIPPPIQPDIRGGPPISKSAGKYWKVDAGAVMKATGEMGDHYTHAVLIQDKNYNQRGKTSVHKEVVNANFRPPLVSVYEDHYSLSRLPTKIFPMQVAPNPGTSDGIYKEEARSLPTDIIRKCITDAVKHSVSIRPSIIIEGGIPMTHDRLPELIQKRPNVAIHSGFNPEIFSTPLVSDRRLDYKNEQISADSGIVLPNGRIDTDIIHREYNRDQYSAASGAVMPIEWMERGNVRDLEYKREQHSAAPSTAMPIEWMDYGTVKDLEYKRDQYSMASGTSMPIESIVSNGNEYLQLDQKNKAISASAGVEMIQCDNLEMYDRDLSVVRDRIDVSAAPTGDNGMRARNEVEYRTRVREPLAPVKYGMRPQADVLPMNIMPQLTGLKRAPVIKRKMYKA